MAPDTSHVKVLFDLEDNEVEALWAAPEGEGYRLDNIPFYIRGIALGDVVRASTDTDGALRYAELLRASEHSTVRLWFEDADHVQAVRRSLRTRGCASELELDRLVAVDIPPHVPYAEVRAFLDAQEAAGVLEYEEGCVAQSGE